MIVSNLERDHFTICHKTRNTDEIEISNLSDKVHNSSVLVIYHKNNRKLNFAESCTPKECDGMKPDDFNSSKNKLNNYIICTLA